MLNLFFIFLIVAIDQVSKHYADIYLSYNQPHVIFPFFNLTLKYNSGAAFGFLSDAGGWQIYVLLFITLAVVAGLFVWLFRASRREILLRASLILIIGGAIGNLIDRVRFTYVIDFFDFHIKSWHFATFNVADAAISCGVVLLIIKMLFFDKHESLTR